VKSDSLTHSDITNQELYDAVYSATNTVLTTDEPHRLTIDKTALANLVSQALRAAKQSNEKG
jgi:hypothetical protein